MKAIIMSLLFMSFSTFAQTWPENLSDLYSTLEEVPFLHDNNTLSGIETSLFKQSYRRTTMGDNAIVTYVAFIPSTDPDCNEDDYFSVSLYTYDDTVKFALPGRSYACHED